MDFAKAANAFIDGFVAYQYEPMDTDPLPPSTLRIMPISANRRRFSTNDIAAGSTAARRRVV